MSEQRGHRAEPLTVDGRRTDECGAIDCCPGAGVVRVGDLEKEIHMAVGVGTKIVNVLTIAGTDPSGGAGVQADLKSISAGGGYGMSVVTALVAQNTQGVREVHLPPVSFLRAQLDAVSDDVRIDAVKIGMLANGEVIDAVAQWIREVQPPLIVLDPVMIAASGDRLLDPNAVAALVRLIPLAQLITPNLPELAVILGETEAATWEAALDQATRLAAQMNVQVLAKGGHLMGPEAPDALIAPDGSTAVFPGARIDTENTHGTGCSLSAGIAVRVARHGGNWPHAVREAKRWLTESIRASDELTVGEGSGPVHHFAGMWARGGVSTTPRIAEIGDEWWQSIAPIRQETDETGFLRQLADGSLERQEFLNYVAQDAIFLREYSRALAYISAMAPTSESQAFWAGSAKNAILGELELHRVRLGGDLTTNIPASVTTNGYVNHLLAACTRGYAEAAAAALPCFWMYTDIGARLAAGEFGSFAQSADHPYAEWLKSYDDPVFVSETEQALRLVAEAAVSVSQDERDRMWRAFEASAVWERDFFAQTAAG